MIPDRDYYEDKYGKLTTDAAKSVAQVAVKGCFLDERIARRFGIKDTLVSVTEPNAVRRVTGRGEPSIQVHKAEVKEEKSQPQEPAEAAEPSADEEAKPAAKKPTAKKEK